MRIALTLAVLALGVAAGAVAGAQPAAPAGSAPQAPAPGSSPRESPEAGPPDADERTRGGRRYAGTITVTWEAPRKLRELFERHLPPPAAEEGERRAASVRPWIRDIRRRVPEIAASEGYFNATVDVEWDDEAARSHATVKVAPGPRTTVGAVEMEFKGDLAGEGDGREARREALRRAWALPVGMPFRSADWDGAKARIVEELLDTDYAAGELADSQAVVDADASKAALRLVLDSGPRFVLGDVRVHGIANYPESVVHRVLDLRRGERYSVKRLQDLQRSLQEGPWFASVVIDVDRRGDPQRAPVDVTVVERPRQDVGLALGYGTDDGARAELAYRNRNLLDRGFDLQSSLRVAQERQLGYADVYLPPGLSLTGTRFGTVPFRDSVGVLAEHSTAENLFLKRFAVAGYRHFRLENFETRAGISYQVERSRPEGGEERLKRALAPIVAGTWRFVDNVFDPTRGGVLNVQLAAGSKALASGADFVKAYGQYQHWIPLGPRDQLLLRAEAGRTFTDDREHLPEDFLFRAGGSRSNRGYAYQSLGVEEAAAIVGGRYMVTGTAEYVHWLDDRWGAAAFVDVGDASDSTSDWKANPSVGVGARFKTPAGPFAIDLAYAVDPKKFRLAFSVTVAF